MNSNPGTKHFKDHRAKPSQGNNFCQKAGLYGHCRYHSGIPTSRNHPVRHLLKDSTGRESWLAERTAVLLFQFHVCLYRKIRRQRRPSPPPPAPALSLTAALSLPSLLPREVFTQLTFYITDADAMEEDNVLVRHLPHHACRFEERLVESERGKSLNCWSSRQPSI